MMGRNHAATGVLAGIATLPLAPHDPVARVAWVAVCGATALLPDFDAPGSTASRAYGYISMVAAAVVGFLAGGHRKGTHDLILSPLMFGAVAWLASLHPTSMTVLLTFLGAVTVRGLAGWLPTVIGTIAALGGSAVAAHWLVSAHHKQLVLLPFVVAMGVFVHILGDWLTLGGIPVPIMWLRGDRRRISANLFRVNGLIENLLVTPLLLAAIAWSWHLNGAA